MKLHHPHTYYWMLRHKLKSIWPESSRFLGFKIYHTPDTMPYPASFLRHVAPREMYDLLSQEKGRGAIDAGACIGFYSLVFSKNFEQVYSFEPHPENLRLLWMNILKNHIGNVTPFGYALGDGHDRVNLWVKDHYKASSSIIQNHLGQPLNRKISVDLRRLDEFQFAKPIDLIKIDVEGAEVMVLEGGRKLIEKQHPYLAIEVHADPIGHDPCECECCRKVRSLGYVIVQTRYHKVEAEDFKPVTVHWILAS